MEKCTDSLLLALAEKNLYGSIRSGKRWEWDMLRCKACNDSFTADTCSIFSPKHKGHDKRGPRLFNEEIRCTEMLCLSCKTYCCYDSWSNKFIFSSKGLNKQIIEDTVDGPMAKYRKVLHGTEIVTSTNCGFRTKNHCVLTYEPTKRRFSYYLSKEIVDSDGIHTLPLKV